MIFNGENRRAHYFNLVEIAARYPQSERVAWLTKEAHLSQSCGHDERGSRECQMSKG
jgi:hypothetical protein